MTRPPPRSTLFPYPPLSRSGPLPPVRLHHRLRRGRLHRRVQEGSRHPDRDDLRRGPLGCVGRHVARSEEHTSELQSQSNLVCRLLLEKKTTERPSTAPSTEG